MFEDLFNFVAPTVLTKKLYEITIKKESDKLVNVIESGLIDLKNKIKAMSENDKKKKKINKKAVKILKIVQTFIEFNK